MKRFGPRTITGLPLAGPVAVGLPPGAATAAAKAADGPHPAPGRSVTAGGSHAGHPVGDITDGSRLSYREGPAGAFPQSVRVDLGGAVEADRIVPKLPTDGEARTQALAVEGGADGSSSTGLPGPAARRFDPGSGNTVTVDSTARDVRRVRVRVSADTGWSAAQSSEVHGGDPGEPPLDGTDPALGKPVEASSTIHSFVAAHANDGRLGGHGESNAHPADLTVGLGVDADLSGGVVRLDPDPVWGEAHPGHRGPRP